MKRNARCRGVVTPVFIGSLVVAFFVVVGGAVLLGKSDGGEINVSDTIQQANQENIDAGGDESQNVGTTPAALRDLPNGGLVPQDSQGTTPTPEPTPEETEGDESDADENEDNVNDETESEESDSGEEPPA